MSVYVDELRNYGWRLGPSCHLFADTEDELHAFAARIGMKRSWFQDKSLPHYDLVVSRRTRAVMLGAIEIDRRQVYAMIKKRRAAILDNAQNIDPKTAPGY